MKLFIVLLIFVPFFVFFVYKMIVVSKEIDKHEKLMDIEEGKVPEKVG